jgi:DNA-binding FadR family transcriptional regulator
MTRPVAFEAVIEELGAAIVSGSLAPGHAESVEQIVARTGFSRSIVREAVRVLVAAGLLTAGRRVGLRVQSAENWDLFDPRVIRWRLASEASAEQVRELRDLRLAVEPEAAMLAALRRSDDEAEGIAAAAAALSRAESAQSFLAADRLFHSRVLSASQNTMFARLSAVIDEALRERAARGARTYPPERAALELHAGIARAIATRASDEAHDLARALIERDAEDGAGA